MVKVEFGSRRDQKKKSQIEKGVTESNEVKVAVGSQKDRPRVEVQ